MSDAPTSEDKRDWEKPVVRDLGSIREIVQGGGKQASFVDGDPHGGRKAGGG